MPKFKKASEVVAAETYAFPQFSKGASAANGQLPSFDMSVKISQDSDPDAIRHKDGSIVYVGADKSCWSPSKGKFVLPEDTNMRYGA